MRNINNMRLWMVIALLFILNATAVRAGDVYSNCVKAYDFGITDNTSLTVYPLNAACVAQCKTQCEGKFSRKNTNGAELNVNTINDCITSCQGGQSYTSRYYTYDTATQKNLLTGVATAASQCTDQTAAKNGAVATMITTAVKGQKVKIGLAPGSQKVYLCGSKTLSLTPVFKQINNSDWVSGALQSVWQDRRQHPCLVGLSDVNWSSLTMAQLANSTYLAGLSRTNATTAVQEATTCLWGARVANFYPTNIYMQNGDELNITWRGDYGHRQLPDNSGFQSRQPALLCMQKYNSSSSSSNSSYYNNCVEWWRRDSSLLVKSLADDDSTLVPTGNAPSEISGEFARGITTNYTTSSGSLTQGSTFDYSTFGCNLSSTGSTWNGLSTALSDQNMDLDTTGAVNSCNIFVKKAGTGYYNFSGTLNGFSASRRLFALRMYDEFNSDPSNNYSGQINWYTDNVGGYSLDIAWGGCPHARGENLQYAISSVGSPIPNQFWVDMPSNMLQNNQSLTLNASTYIGNNASSDTASGTLYLRIKPDTPPNGASSTISALYTSPGNYRGSYSIAVTQPSISVSDGPVQKLITSITSTLLGVDLSNLNAAAISNGGAIGALYKGVIIQTNFVNIIRALLAFFIAFTAVGYLIGIIKMNQQDALVRLMKVSVVLALVSSTSWDMFNTYFIGFFIYGGFDLLNLATVDPLDTYLKTQNTSYTSGAFHMFSSIDGPILMILSKKFWYKVSALLFNGGLVIVVMIVVSCVFYILALLKGTVIFIYSIVMLSILLIMAPIFIPLLLFQLTKNIFDGWWKALLSFMLQPVMVFTAFSLFNLTIQMIIYIVLGVTVCPTYCFVNIFDKCYLPIYRVINDIHINSDSISFAASSSIGLAGILFLLSYSMYYFCAFFTELTARIVSGTPNRLATTGGVADQTVSWNAGNRGDDGIKGAINRAIEAGVSTKNRAVAGYRQGRTPRP